MCTISALPANLRYKLARTHAVIQPCLCFPNSCCQKATWGCMSTKQERRRKICLPSTNAGERLPPTQLKFLAAAPPVIDHAGPQVSNNLSWHFIQAI